LITRCRPLCSARIDQLIAKIRAGAWRPMSCGDGAHGPKEYDNALEPPTTANASNASQL